MRVVSPRATPPLSATERGNVSGFFGSLFSIFLGFGLHSDAEFSLERLYCCMVCICFRSLE